MSKNGREWLIAISLIAAFIAYVVFSDRQKQNPASFDNRLIGSWVSNEAAALDDGSVVPVMLQIDFDADHSWRNTIHDPAGESVSHKGTWRLRTDPDLVSPSSSRILVLTGLGPGSSEHLVVFAGQEILTELMQSKPNEMRRWKRNL